MNLKTGITKEQLKDLLRACDHERGHHLLWVARNGDVKIELLNNVSPIGFVKSRNDIQFRYECFSAGSDYVGPNAVEDDLWVDRLFASLNKEWTRLNGHAECWYIDEF